MNITELDSYNLSDAVKFNNQLNPAVWQGQKMKPEVREHLLAIAKDFKEFLGLSDLEVKDITVSGSNAGYTYTPHSDIDLHLVVDIPQADSDDVYRELFDAKKYQYNDAHAITIGGYDVELYVENANKPPQSQGIYSVLNNDWVKIPLKRRADINDEAVKSKFEDIGHRIESAVAGQDLSTLDNLATKIKNMRQAGLDEHGELGPENLAYKMLRNQGLIKKLYDARTAAQDARLSLDERKKKKKKRSPVRYGYTFNVVNDVADSGDAGGDVAMETAEANPSDEDILKDFIDFCFKELKLKELPQVKLRRDPQWSVVHKTFGRYIDDRNMLEVAWGQRHIMDVLRTVAHELTHRRQHEREDVPLSAGETGSPYENEANARAGILMRDYARLHPEYFEAGQAEQLHGDEISESTDQQVFGIAGHKVILKDGYFYIYKGDQLIYRSPTPRVYTKEKLIQAAEKAINTINDPHKTFYKSAPGQGVEAAYKKLLQVITHRLDKDLDIDPTTIKNDIAITAKDFGVSEKELRKQWAKVKPYKYSRFPELFAPYSKFSRYFTYNSSGVGPLTKVRMSGGRDQWLNDQMTKYMNQYGINISESSGYIPTRAQTKLPQFSNALSVDVHPGQVGKEANKLDLETDSQGHPKLLIKGLKNALREFKETGALPKTQSRFDRMPLTQEPGGVEDDLGNQEAMGPEFPPEFPEGTTKIDVSDVYDWYKLGQDISDLDDANPEDYNQGPPQTVISFPSDEAEQAYLKQFKRLGLKTHDIDQGKEHVHESEQLDEVKMSPTALKKFAASDAAKGIVAGFEAELIFRDTQGDDSGDDYEADYDADERPSTIDDVIDFFSNDDYGYGLSDRQADRLRSQLDEAYFEWRDDKIMNDFDYEAKDLIEEVWLEERPMVERIHDALTDGLGLTDAEADAVVKLHDQRAKKEISGSDMSEEQLEMASQYGEARTIAEDILEEEVEASLDNQDGYYDQALQNFQDNWDGDDSGFFNDMGWRWMSSIANEYNLDWPIMTGGGGNGGSRDWSDIAHDLEQVTGKKVVVGSSYHSARRKPNEYVLEPDSSLDPDEREDFGLELVSPPMPLDEAIEQLNAIVDWANSAGDAYTNSSTGLHMGVSIPYKGGDVDYLKLITFLGDQYVLEKFGRSANTYCDSAMKKLKQNVAGSKNRNDDKIASAMELMKHGLIELAQKYVQQGVGNSKYTSAHIKPGYIEFRSPGGDYLSQADRGDITDLEDTMRRFAYAMYLAGRPDLERKEYYKKLYKLIAPEGNKDLELFSKFSSGEITADELKKQWADKVIAKEVPVKSDRSNWRLYNRRTGEPVPNIEYGNYTEMDALERAKAKVSPASSMEDFKQAYELRDVGTNTGRWRVIRRDNHETLEIIDAPTRGEANDQARESYTDVIPFYIEPYGGTQEPEPEPKLSRRAKLAKQIAQPADYVIINKHSGLPFYTFRASSNSQAVDFGVTYLRDRNLDVGNFSVQRASNVKQAIDNRVDSKQLQARVTPGNYEFVYEPTGRVLDQVDGITGIQANAVLADVRRRYNDLPADSIVIRVREPQVRDIPITVDQDAEQTQVRMPNGVPVWELVDKDTNHPVHVIADHTAQEAWRQATQWLTSVGAEDPGTWHDRFAIRPKQLQTGERNNPPPINEMHDKAQEARDVMDAVARELGYKDFASAPTGAKNSIMLVAVERLNLNGKPDHSKQFG